MIIQILQRNFRPYNILALASFGLSAYMKSLSNWAAICCFWFLFFPFRPVQFKFSSGFTMTEQFYSAKVEVSQDTQMKRFSDELGEIHYAERTSLFSVAFGKVEQAVGDY